MTQSYSSDDPFSRQLQQEVPEQYKSFYVAYDALKWNILLLEREKRRAGNGRPDESSFRYSLPEARYRVLYASEARKCNQFAKMKYEEIRQVVQILARRLHQIALPKESGVGETSTTKELSKIEKDLDSTSVEVVHLDFYIRSNYKALMRLGLFFNKIFDASLTSWYMANLVKEPFCGTDIDSLLVLLSLCWQRFRRVQSAMLEQLNTRETNTGAWKPPDSFVRSTTKYWVKPGFVTRCKAAIIKHVPYLIFGSSSQDLEVLLDPLSAQPCEASVPNPQPVASESQMVTSVYFDNDDAYSYMKRIAKLEGATLVRFRWYGDNLGEKDKEVFIERKTHHESWSGEPSAKERFSLPQQRVRQFMTGRLDVEDYVQKVSTAEKRSEDDPKIKSIRRLATAIQDHIVAHSLKPMIRTAYLRAAFQLATSNDVRFSLDTNLCVVNEHSSTNRGQFWCRVGEDVLAKDEVARFPYAVLEVKLQVDSPTWVTQMLCDVEAIEVSPFSKFQHGMAFLHNTKVKILPHWFHEFVEHGFVPGITPPRSINEYHSPGKVSPRKHSGMVPYGGFTRPFGLKPGSGRGSVPVPSFEMHGPQEAPPGTSTISLLSHFYPRAGHTGLSTLFTRTKWGRRRGEDEPDQDEAVAAMKRRAKTVSRVDPKALFASERTFLHYCQKGLYIAALASALIAMGSPSAAAAGMCLAVTAIVVFVFALVMMIKRQARIKRRVMGTDEFDTRLDCPSGPVVVFFILSTVIVSTMVLNISLHRHNFLSTKPRWSRKRCL